jgi:hypothetical protein
MKFKYCPQPILIVLALSLVSLGAHSALLHKKNTLNTLGFPLYPGGKLVSHTVVPPGPILHSMEKEIGASLPVSHIKEVKIVAYCIDSAVEGPDVLKYYSPTFDAQKWKTMVSTVARDGDVTEILTKEKTGMLIVDVDPPGPDRDLTFILVSGTVDTSKIDRKFAEKAGAMIDTKMKPGIPAGSPISIPPSEKLDIESVKSNIRAHFAGENTAQINLANNSDNAGDLIRTPDGRLMLSLAPNVQINDILLPSGVPVLLEPTNGSLTITGGNAINEKPLSIMATGAPVKIRSFPLVSGTHNIRVVGKSADISLGEVTGGALEVEVEGGNIFLALPSTSSARLDASVVSGSIGNYLTKDKPIGDALSFMLGDGKARISLKAVNGNVIIREGK